ncbi:MAG: hypothetical protein ACREPQ_00990 [Rhodanobacter sp.]
MKSKSWWTALAVLFLWLPSHQAHALDPQAAQSYCTAVQQSALNAQKNYIQNYTPQQDPQQTFMDATNSCMSTIANFTITVPPNLQAIQPIIQRVAQQLLMQACQAAQQQFQSAVNRALQSVTSSTPQIGLDVNLNSSSGPTLNTSGTNIGNVVVPPSGIPLGVQ